MCCAPCPDAKMTLPPVRMFLSVICRVWNVLWNGCIWSELLKMAAAIQEVFVLCSKLDCHHGFADPEERNHEMLL